MRKFTRFKSFALIPALCLLSLSSCKEEDKFAAADKNSDGVITLDEFSEYMVGYLFSRADANGDGVVTYDEWRAINPDADRDKFLALDSDGDGVVSFQEAKTRFEAEGTAASLFQQIDADGDGRITREEAAAYLEAVEAQARSEVSRNN